MWLHRFRCPCLNYKHFSSCIIKKMFFCIRICLYFYFSSLNKILFILLKHLPYYFQQKSVSSSPYIAEDTSMTACKNIFQTEREKCAHGLLYIRILSPNDSERYNKKHGKNLISRSHSPSVGHVFYFHTRSC
jgi:hypothetical protein